jgi:hypothetical protein
MRVVIELGIRSRFINLNYDRIDTADSAQPMIITPLSNKLTALQQ